MRCIENNCYDVSFSTELCSNQTRESRLSILLFLLRTSHCWFDSIRSVTVPSDHMKFLKTPSQETNLESEIHPQLIELMISMIKQLRPVQRSCDQVI